MNHLVITSHPNLVLHKLRSKKPESKKDIYHFQMDNGADIVTSLERKVINAVVNASPKAGKARVQLVNVFVVVQTDIIIYWKKLREPTQVAKSGVSTIF